MEWEEENVLWLNRRYAPAKAVGAVFLMMLLGFVFRRVGFVDKVFADRINAFVFKAALPVLLTTFLSAFTLTGWLYVLRVMDLI